MNNTRKQILIFIAFFVIDLLIAYTITGLLGVQNTIIIQSFSSMGDITYEVLICLLLVFVEATILDYIEKKKKV